MDIKVHSVLYVVNDHANVGRFPERSDEETDSQLQNAYVLAYVSAR